MTILDFCGYCGVLLRPGTGLLPENEQVCENCGHPISKREWRIQGEFSEEEAANLNSIFFPE